MVVLLLLGEGFMVTAGGMLRLMILSCSEQLAQRCSYLLTNHGVHVLHRSFVALPLIDHRS